MISQEEIEEARTQYGNFTTFAQWKPELSKKQGEWLEDNFSGLVYCHGQLRKVVYEYSGDKCIMHTEKA